MLPHMDPAVSINSGAKRSAALFCCIRISPDEWNVTSHTRTKLFAVWCGACSPDWAQGPFPLAEGQFGMENAPLPVTM